MRPMILAIALSAAACGGDGDSADNPDTTDVTDDPCGIECPAQIDIALVTRGDAASDVLAAIDAQTTGCKGEGIETNPNIIGPGTYDDVLVTAYEDGPGTSCQTRIVVEEAYPIVNERLISAHLDGAATVGVVAWDVAPGAAIDQVRITFDAGDGTFAEVDTVAATLGTFELPPLTGDRGAVTLVALTGDAFAGSSLTIPIYRITSDAYNLSNQAVPDVGFDTSVTAVVRAPATAEARPLVLFLHGNHENCIDGTGFPYCDFTDAHECNGTPFPNAEGYVYLMETLAAQGYVTASISANAINCRDDGIFERGALILEHIKRWKAWTSAAPPAPFADGRFTGHVDLAHVSIVGHSRGGDGAAWTPQLLKADPIAGVTLDSVLAIAPTDFHGAEPADSHYGLMLAACDGDVSDLQGKRQYDAILDNAATGRERSQLFLPGANHNFFNTSWEFDDTDYIWFGGTACRPAVRVGGPAQRAIMEDYLGRWLEAAGDADAPAYLRGEVALPASTQAWAGVDLAPRWSYASDDRLPIDDFAAPLATNELGGSNTFVGLSGSTTCTSDCYLFDHQLDAIRVAWAENATAQVTLTTPGGVDIGAGGALSMRVAARYAYAEPLMDNVDVLAFEVVVEDGAGQVARVFPSASYVVPATSPDYWDREILQTVRVTAAQLVADNPAFDVTSIASIGVAGQGIGDVAAVFWLTNVDVDPGA